MPTSSPPSSPKLSVGPSPSPLPARLPRPAPATIATPSPPPTVLVLLELTAGEIRLGRQFEVRATIGAGTDRPVDTAQVHLEFDPAKLQVESLSSGPRLEYLLLSTWDNSLGNVKYAAGTLGPAVETPFTLFKATFSSQATNRQRRHPSTVRRPVERFPYQSHHPGTGRHRPIDTS